MDTFVTPSTNVLRLEPRVFKLVLTGGPCSGKTTAMARLSNFLRERHFRVYVVPEGATLYFLGGASVSDLSSARGRIAFQQTILASQVAIEESFERLGRATDMPCVLLCDRGLMDGKAYASQDEWLASLSILFPPSAALSDEVKIREDRYDGVFHLVTAADGAEKFYTLSNNVTRTETVEQAIAIDRKTQAAWTGHPRHFVIDNSSNFESKLQRLVSHVAAVCGLTKSRSKSTIKFMLLNDQFDGSHMSLSQWNDAVKSKEFVRNNCRLPDLNSSGITHQVFHIDKIFIPTEFAQLSVLISLLQDTDVIESCFIRKRSCPGNDSYGLTIVLSREGETIEQKRIISAQEYENFKLAALNASPTNRLYQQTRIYFLVNNFTYVIYHHHDSGLCSLHWQCDDDVIKSEFLSAYHDQANNDPMSVTMQHRLPGAGNAVGFDLIQVGPVMTTRSNNGDMIIDIE